MPSLVEAMERHGHLALEPHVRALLLDASASTIDRLLRTVHRKAHGRRSRRRRTKSSQAVPVRTFSDWNTPMVGYNDSAFINDTVIELAQVNGLEFTRSRPHQCNDQAWIEQKNGALVRRFVG